MPDFRQGGFHGGEVSPTIWGRTDLPQVAFGLRTCKNFFITPHGAAVSRPGTVWVAETKFSTTYPSRLVKFMVEAGTSFVLEFGNNYLRFYQNGQPVLSSGSPYEVATPYAAADLALLKFAQSGDVLTIVHPSYPPMDLTRFAANIWTLQAIDFPRNYLSVYAFGAQGTGGSNSNYCAGNASVYAAGTTYKAAQYVLYNGTVFISLGDANLGNTPNAAGPTAWWAPAQDTSHTAQAWHVAVTTVYRDQYGVVRESLPVEVFPGASPTATTVTISQDRPALWCVATTFPSTFGSAPPSTPLAVNFYRGKNGLLGFIGATPVGSTPPAAAAVLFNDAGSDPDYTIGPPAGLEPFAATPTPRLWDPSSSYILNSQVWWQGKVWNGRGVSVGQQPDLVPASWASADFSLSTPYTAGTWANFQNAVWLSIKNGFGWEPDINPTFWQRVCVYPSTVGYFEQRLVLGGSSGLESALALSATGQRTNFDQSSLNTNPAQPLNPTKATSSLLLYLASRDRDQIRAIVDGRSMLVLTSLGEWSVRGAGGGPLTSTSFDAKKHSRYGSSWLDPLICGHTVLFNTVQGSRVRDLVYNFYADSYSGKDVSVKADHLFRGHSIVDWAYAAVPYSIVYAVRDDGVLLGLTYQNAPLTDFEQDDKIDAWHWHDTNGRFESVCVVQEGNEDAVYVVVNRNSRRHVERFATRLVSDIRTFIGLDQAVVIYDGRNTDASQWIQLTASSWSAGSIITFTTNSSLLGSQPSGFTVVLDCNGTLYPLGDAEGAPPFWNSTLAYPQDAVVQWRGKAYFSLGAANIGNLPDISPTAWAPANGPFTYVVTIPAGMQIVSDGRVPPALRAVNHTGWGLAQAQFNTLPSTTIWKQAPGTVVNEGVTVVADGVVALTIASWNPLFSLPIVLSQPALIVIGGLPFTAQLETLDLSSPRMELRSTVKTVTRAGVETELTWQLDVQNTFDPTRGGDPVTWTPDTVPFTGFDHAYIKDRMDHLGRVAFTLTVPMPATILAVTRDVELGGSS